MEIDQSVPPPEPEAWQMETKGFTQLPKTKVITPLRPTPGFSNRPSKRDKVTSVLEIKQLAWAEGNRESSARTAKDYNQYLKNTNPERSLEKSCCWLCGKPFYEKPLGNPKHLGYLEVEHALPLKLGYMLLTIPGEIVYNGTDKEEKTSLKDKNRNVYYDNNIYAINQTYSYKRNDETKLEILRSHRLCNNLKSNVNFIKYTGSKRWEIKNEVVKLYQDKLQELQTHLNGDNIKRPVQMDKSKLYDIVRHLNNKFSKNNNQNVDVYDVVEFVKKKSYVEHKKINTENYALELEKYLYRNDGINEQKEEDDDKQTINTNFENIKKIFQPNLPPYQENSTVRSDGGSGSVIGHFTPLRNDASSELKIERVSSERVDNIDITGKSSDIYPEKLLKEEIEKLKNLIEYREQFENKKLTRFTAAQLRQLKFNEKNLKNRQELENLQKKISSLEKGHHENLELNRPLTKGQKAEILEKLKEERRVAYDGVRPRNPDTLKREYVTPPSNSRAARALLP